MRGKVGILKAARLHEYKKPLILDEVPIPKIGPKEALVKINACGVCHTDISLIDGDARNLPLTLGHEPSGDVVEVGRDVDQIKAGDRVVASFYLTCGECYYCRIGRETLCTSLVGHLGFNYDGGYAEYLKSPARSLVPLPKEVPYDVGGICGDAVATSYHAVTKRAKVHAGSNVIVHGAGGLGLSTIQFAKLVGARVIAVDIRDEKLDFARKMGADEVIDSSKKSAVEEVKRLTDGEGADYIFEFVGGAQTIDQAIKSLRRAGKLVIIGHVPEKFSATASQLISGELEIIGSRANTRQDLIDTLKLVAEKKIRIKPIITNKYPLYEVNIALDLLRKGEILGRAVVEP
jgi:propanol-preferring alcohol dehydrogenase